MSPKLLRVYDCLRATTLFLRKTESTSRKWSLNQVYYSIGIDKHCNGTITHNGITATINATTALRLPTAYLTPFNCGVTCYQWIQKVYLHIHVVRRCGAYYAVVMAYITKRTVLNIWVYQTVYQLLQVMPIEYINNFWDTNSINGSYVIFK